MWYFYSFFWSQEQYRFCTYSEFNQHLSVLIIAANTLSAPACDWRVARGEALEIYRTEIACGLSA